jgi:hypothetical protein
MAYAFYQPIIAEHGSGIYSIGIADYTIVNVIYNRGPYGTAYNKPGDNL